MFFAVVRWIWAKPRLLTARLPTGYLSGLPISNPAEAGITMPFPVPLEKLASVVPAFNANGLVNAIPYVCASAPGILTTEGLPHILARGPHPIEGSRSYARG